MGTEGAPIRGGFVYKAFLVGTKTDLHNRICVIDRIEIEPNGTLAFLYRFDTNKAYLSTSCFCILKLSFELTFFRKRTSELYTGAVTS